MRGTDDDPEADIENLDVSMVDDSLARWRHNGHADIIRERIDGSRGE